MKIAKFHIYLADLSPRFGTEPGKIRPVVVIQTDLLNHVHMSTIVCPLSTKIRHGFSLIRIHVPKEESGLDHNSDILVDQIRAIDNLRFKKFIGKIPLQQQNQLLESLQHLIIE